MTETPPSQELEESRTDVEQERILLAAREAKTTIVAVAALTIGSMVFMFLITLVIVALKLL